jgi:hypothetical protein
MLGVVGTTYFSKSSSRPEAKSFCLKEKKLAEQKNQGPDQKRSHLVEGKNKLAE